MSVRKFSILFQSQQFNGILEKSSTNSWKHTCVNYFWMSGAPLSAWSFWQCKMALMNVWNRFVGKLWCCAEKRINLLITLMQKPYQKKFIMTRVVCHQKCILTQFIIHLYADLKTDLRICFRLVSIIFVTGVSIPVLSWIHPKTCFSEASNKNHQISVNYRLTLHEAFKEPSRSHQQKSMLNKKKFS